MENKKPTNAVSRVIPGHRIVKLPISTLKPSKYNPRAISDKAIAGLQSSIEKFGLVEPIVFNEATGNVVGGHQRLKALQKLGHKEVDVVIVNLTEHSEKELNLALNNPHIQGEFTSDIDSLLKEILENDPAGFKDLLLDKIEIPQMEESELPADIDDVPEPPKKPITKTGDLWLMGDHRLYCGDSTKMTDVKNVMNGKKAVLMNTDPPYGVNYGDVANSRMRGTGMIEKQDYSQQPHPSMKNDDLEGMALQKFLEKAIRYAVPHLIENPAFYLWHPMLTQGTFFAAAAAAAADILIHRQIIWVKPSLIMGRGDYHWRHELCFYGWIRGRRCRWLMGRDQDTVWEVKRELSGVHPTQKPLELFIRPIKNHCYKGDIVYEPFGGSGSQFIAAEEHGVKCYGIEIDPSYCDVIVSRWEQFSGKKAKRIS